MCAGAFACAHAQTLAAVENLRSLSLEELSAVQISSVSRRLQPLDEAPAAAYVITSEDIRRSGATSLPEVLRLAPNLNVGRDDGNSWAVSARGFNSIETSNKLLVLVDTRSIYSSLHAGVFWDQEMVFVEDIERVEVISGPGGALWGANAVNGVINVITKNSADTHGVAGRVTAGTRDSTASARIGGPLGRNGNFRVYGTAFDFGHTLTAARTDAGDDFDGLFGGVRTDWTFGSTTAAVQAEAFDADISTGGVWGGYLRGRVSHNFDSGHRLFVQAYYDRSDRKQFGFNEAIDTYDLTLQHTWAPMGGHQIITGGGYRVTEDRYFLLGPFALQPAQDTHELWNAFIQDTVALGGAVDLTAGVKFEHSSYSGFEYMPSARLSWTPAEGHLLWTAVSRAVRTPVRIESDLVAPAIFIGGPRYASEELIAYEAGYRTRRDAYGFSVSLFLHDYDDLRTTSPLAPAPGPVLPAEFRNALHGQTYGVEVWGDYDIRDWWRVSAGVTTLEKDFSLDPGFRDIASPPSTGNDPSHQVMLHSRMNVTPDVEFDAGLRWVGELDAIRVPAYVELEARLAWRVSDRLELSLVGNNLLSDSHPETIAEPPLYKVRRGVYIGANWGF